MKKKISMIIALGLALGMALSSCGSKDKEESEESSETVTSEEATEAVNGAESGETALQNFAQAHIDKDIDAVCEISAPEELWDYICDDAGLAPRRLIYEMRGGEDKFNKSSDHWVEYLEEEKRDVSDFKISEETECDEDLYTKFNKVMKLSDVDKTVDKLYVVQSNYINGYIYEMDGGWYYGPDWLIEDILDIAYDGYKNWNS